MEYGIYGNRITEQDCVVVVVFCSGVAWWRKASCSYRTGVGEHEQNKAHVRFVIPRRWLCHGQLSGLRVG